VPNSCPFGFIKMRPGQRQRGSKRFVRGVHTEEVTGSKPVSPTNRKALLTR